VRFAKMLTNEIDGCSRQATLGRPAVLTADVPRVSSFLGKKITPVLAQEIGSRLSTRTEGRCIKHCMVAASVKMYDKFSRVLRIETTSNDISFCNYSARF
jgi:hypothetical protein